MSEKTTAIKYRYIPKGVCARQIEFEIEDRTLKNVAFCGGCNGNLKAIGILVEGKDIDEVTDLLKGITCGQKPTSCADQLARAIEEARQKQRQAG
jgi:uncharacterized protein (TIGR03905 family)